MLWLIYIFLLSICLISEFIQIKYKTNNNIRSIFLLIIFIYHFISIQGMYFDVSYNLYAYSLSYWIGFFLPGIIITIIEIYFLIKTFKTKTNNDK